MFRKFMLSAARLAVIVVGLCCAPAVPFGQTAPPAPAPSPAEQAVIDEILRLEKEGNAAYDRADFAAARKAWEACLEKEKGRNKPEATAYCLDHIGQTYYSQAQYDKAMDYLRQALAIYESLKYPPDTARVYLNIGNVYNHLDQNDKALDYYKKALAIYEKTGNPADISGMTNNIGILSFNTGDYDTALDYYQKALTIREKLGKPEYIADSLTCIGNAYHMIGQDDKSLKYLLQGLVLYEKLGNPAYIAAGLQNVGVLYDSLGEKDRALETYNRALELQEKTGNPQDAGETRMNIGILYCDLGQYDKALDELLTAVSAFEKIGNPQEIAEALNNISNLYNYLGQNDKALDYAQRALDLREKVGNQGFIADSLSSIGIIYDDMALYEKSLQYNTKAQAVFEKVGTPESIAHGLVNIGLDYNNLGQCEKALDYEQRALAIQEKVGRTLDIAGALTNIGVVHLTAGENEKALESFQKALPLYDKLGNPKYIAGSYRNLGSAYAGLKQWEKAEGAYSRARRNFEDFSQQVGDPTELADLQQTMKGFYEDYADALVEQKREGEGLALLEAGRAMGLARQIALNGSDYTAYFTAAEKEALKRNTDAVAIASNLLHTAEAKLASCAPEKRAAFQKQREGYAKQQEDAERQYTAYRDGLFAHYPQFKEVLGERPPTVAELKSLAQRNPDTLYLTWALLDDKTTLLFALTAKDGLKTYTLSVGEKALNAQVADWRFALLAGGAVGSDAPGKNEAKQAKALYQALFAPLAQDGLMTPGRYKHLVTVSTGPLLDIPFAALETPDGKRLIETHTVSAAIALGIAFWRDNPLTPTADLLCVADPIGRKEPAAVKEVVLRGGGWSALPGAQTEGREISALFAKQSLLIGPAARKADVLKAMPGAKFLHFATHGYLNDKDPLLSGLVLAPEPEGSRDDGVLSAREILNLPMAARLAVLSACETGRGVAKGGEGLQGLAWAFRAAGCPCVVASQWQIDDSATRDLMLAFYKAIQAGKRKDDAMRAAMLAIKAGEAVAVFLGRVSGYRGHGGVVNLSVA